MAFVDDPNHDPMADLEAEWDAIPEAPVIDAAIPEAPVVNAGQMILSTTMGDVHSCRYHTITNQPEDIDTEAFKEFLEPIDVAVATSRAWIMVRGKSDLSLVQVIDTLVKLNSVTFGLCKLPDSGEFLMLLRKRRQNSRCFSFLDELQTFGFKSPDNARAQTTQNINLLKIMTKVNVEVTVNYMIKPTTKSSGSDVHMDKAIDAVVEKVKSMTPKEFETSVIRAKCVPKDSKTVEDLILVSGQTNLKALRKEAEESKQIYNKMKISSSSPHVIPYQEFEKLKQQEVWFIDLDSYAIVKKTVDQFIKDGDWIEKTLVILGNARLAKTPGAQSILAMLAVALQCDENDDVEKEAYYLKMGTVESIKKVEMHLQEGTPLLFDDITPSDRRGTRPSMNFNEVLSHPQKMVVSSAMQGMSTSASQQIALEFLPAMHHHLPSG
eukprot:TRINITY_DN3293_c0_g1_i1.p1 TRINITY_DN3293_c0_g1~~TRINITY_DN3293_c0_g1_i1.p1  ORF type:complete len:437 (+),score=80.55 TRINITY_DN3293_c0_g1_i1:77-1387(+)